MPAMDLEELVARIHTHIARTGERVVYLRANGRVYSMPSSDLRKVPVNRLIGVYDRKASENELMADISWALKNAAGGLISKSPAA